MIISTGLREAADMYSCTACCHFPCGVQLRAAESQVLMRLDVMLCWMLSCVICAVELLPSKAAAGPGRLVSYNCGLNALNWLAG